jgi:hypothetical protein
VLEKESLPSVVPPSLGLPLPPLVLIFGASANCGRPFVFVVWKKCVFRIRSKSARFHQLKTRAFDLID